MSATASSTLWELETGPRERALVAFILRGCPAIRDRPNKAELEEWRSWGRRVAALAYACRPAPSPLTVKQEQVLEALARGAHNDEIADELGIRKSTVRSHLYNLYVVLGVHERAQAVLAAVQRGWL